VNKLRKYILSLGMDEYQNRSDSTD